MAQKEKGKTTLFGKSYIYKSDLSKRAQYTGETVYQVYVHEVKEGKYGVLAGLKFAGVDEWYNLTLDDDLAVAAFQAALKKEVALIVDDEGFRLEDMDGNPILPGSTVPARPSIATPGPRFDSTRSTQGDVMDHGNRIDAVTTMAQEYFSYMAIVEAAARSKGFTVEPVDLQAATFTICKRALNW